MTKRNTKKTNDDAPPHGIERPADAIAAELSHQPTLPTLELPEYHGQRPVAMRFKVRGVGSRISRPHTIGDRVVLVVEAKVEASGHKGSTEGILYVEDSAAIDLFELVGDQGSRLLSTLRSLYRTGEDALKGRRQVPGLGDTGYTDSGGVVLTPAEVAEIRGDPVRAILAPELTPAVVVFSDNDRLLWPDEFPADYPRPRVGAEFRNEGGATVVVEKLLDAMTGENLPQPGAPPSLPDDDDDGAVDPIFDAADAADDASTFDDGPDPFAGGELGEDKAAEWETAERCWPTKADRAAGRTAALGDWIDCDIAILRKRVDDIDDVELARGALVVELDGRGRSAKPRPNAVKLLETRIAFLEDSGNQ